MASQPISTQNSGHLSFRARVPVFDANIGVGHCHDRPSPFADAAGLRAEMQRHGVERGLIYHLQGEAISAIEGNEALRAWRGDGRGSFAFPWCQRRPDADPRDLGAFRRAR